MAYEDFGSSQEIVSQICDSNYISYVLAQIARYSKRIVNLNVTIINVLGLTL